MVLGGGGLGKWLGREGGALMMTLVPYNKKDPREPPAPSTLWGHSKKMSIYSPEESSLQNLILLAP